MITVAIDGACRRNGKPDCVAAGGAFFMYYEDGDIAYTMRLTAYESESTNQRGEMLALLTTLQCLYATSEDVRIITDSEYLFNAMTKHWPDRWAHNGWRTAAGEPVKNADLWKQILEISQIQKADISYYHIKGHVIPFGAVTARNLVDDDVSGLTLYKRVCEQYDKLLPTKADVLEHAQALSEKNNGFRLPDHILKDFVTSNVVADIVATQAVDEADRKI